MRTAGNRPSHASGFVDHSPPNIIGSEVRFLLGDMRWALAQTGIDHPRVPSTHNRQWKDSSLSSLGELLQDNPEYVAFIRPHEGARAGHVHSVIRTCEANTDEVGLVEENTTSFYESRQKTDTANEEAIGPDDNV